MNRSKLEKSVKKRASDICARLRKQGYDKCPIEDSWKKLGEEIRNIAIQKEKRHLTKTQKINSELEILAMWFCGEDINSAEGSISRLKELGVPLSYIKNSEIYNLASKCIEKEFNRYRRESNYLSAVNIVNLARRLDIKITSVTEKLYTLVDTLYGPLTIQNRI